jgi:hypothetical protein
LTASTESKTANVDAASQPPAAPEPDASREPTVDSGDKKQEKE